MSTHKKFKMLEEQLRFEQETDDLKSTTKQGIIIDALVHTHENAYQVIAAHLNYPVEFIERVHLGLARLIDEEQDALFKLYQIACNKK